ncbi:MFS transporter [Reyranella sp.]|uniref:MFS transporter n=1 Tax=Reyranella sp. TaxID=1929291 RepID=UPI003D136ECC
MFHGWRVVAACFVIAAVAWGLGTFGASVYLQAVTAAHGWPIADVAFAVTLFYLVSALVQRSVGRGIDRWGPRPVLLSGAISMALGVSAIGLIEARWQLYPCFVLIGLGWAALSTTGIAATVAPWFERHQGRSMALAIMGASVGAIVGVPALQLAIRRFGLEQGLLIVGAVAAVLLLPLIARVLRFRRPEEIGLQRDGHASLDEPTPAPVSPPIATAANRPVLLWSAAAAFALGLAMQIGFITHHVTLAQPLLGVEGAGFLVSATGGSAFIGRLILARIVDGVSVRKLACVVMIAQAAALLSLALWPTAPVLVGASLVYGYGIGHITTLGPIVVRREFGAAAFGATYGVAASAIQLVSAFGPAAIGVLRDSLGGYRPGLAIASAVTLIACAILFTGGRLAARS